MNLRLQWSSRLAILSLLLVFGSSEAAGATKPRPGRQVTHLSFATITISESADPVYIGDEVTYVVGLSYLHSSETQVNYVRAHLSVANGTITSPQ